MVKWHYIRRIRFAPVREVALPGRRRYIEPGQPSLEEQCSGYPPADRTMSRRSVDGELQRIRGLSDLRPGRLQSARQLKRSGGLRIDRCKMDRVPSLKRMTARRRMDPGFIRHGEFQFELQHHRPHAADKPIANLRGHQRHREYRFVGRHESRGDVYDESAPVPVRGQSRLGHCVGVYDQCGQRHFGAGCRLAVCNRSVARGDRGGSHGRLRVRCRSIGRHDFCLRNRSQQRCTNGRQWLAVRYAIEPERCGHRSDEFLCLCGQQQQQRGDFHLFDCGGERCPDAAGRFSHRDGQVAGGGHRRSVRTVRLRGQPGRWNIFRLLH